MKGGWNIWIPIIVAVVMSLLAQDHRGINFLLLFLVIRDLMRNEP